MAILLLTGTFLLVFSSHCYGHTKSICHVDSSLDFERYLCNNTLSSHCHVFSLNSSVEFKISSGNFCQVAQQTGEVKIRSDSVTEFAFITCFEDDIPGILPQPRRGLVFFNSHVTLERLVFKNCGTKLTTIPDGSIIDYFNSSSLYYTSSHAATLVFVNCQVNITQVNIYNSYGFAMIGINLYNASISHVNMSLSTLSSKVYSYSNKSVVIGSGAVFHYVDPPPKNHYQKCSYIDIKHVYFRHNFNMISGNQCIADFYHSNPFSLSGSKHPIVNAAGLTLLYTQKNYSVKSNINDTTFNYNVGAFSSPGGLLVVHYYSSIDTITTVKNSQFLHNVNIGSSKSYCQGTALLFLWFGESVLFDLIVAHQLLVQKTIFYENSGIHISSFGSGPVLIAVVNPATIKIVFKNCTFHSNAAYQEGASMYAIAYKDAFTSGNVSIVLEDIYGTLAFQSLQFLPVSAAGIFSFYRIHTVYITGTSTFCSNYGSVIEAVDSNIYLSGNLSFSDNWGLRGSAIRLHGDSHLYFLSGVTAKFMFNHAQLEGGAIYIGSSDTTNTLKRDCMLTIFDPSNSLITFHENIAINAGNSIYMESISNCYLNSSVDHISSTKEILEYYEKHFHFNPSSSNHLLSLSSQSSKLVQCDSNNNHKDVVIPYKTYPGQVVQIYLAVLDVLCRNVYSTMRIDVTSKILQHRANQYVNNKLWLSHEDKEQIVYEGPNCTLISIAVNSHDHTQVVGELVFSLPRFPGIYNIQLFIRQCPLGFILDKDKGVCRCSPVFYRRDLVDAESIEYKASCNINNMTIARPNIANSWAGNTSFGGSKSFGVSRMCPLEYCSCLASLSFCSSDNSISLVSPLTGTCNDSIPLCLHQRVGPLCGSCGELSVVFGSPECRHCSNWWIWTLVLYAVAGPLLIYLLFVFRLTLTTGTLNGIIFYAQAANCSLYALLSNCNMNDQIIAWISRVAFTFLSLLNLNLGFPLCFYNGMTELWKTGLSLVFPLYLLTILCIIIFISRCSTKLSNNIADSSVQVLVTVVHLSFTKLLLVIIDVFTPAQVYTSNATFQVWYIDGSQQYGVGSHFILMVITLLVVIPLLLPYVLLLLFAKPLRRTRVNKYVRPLLEAIHAPYKDGKEYWFVARLFLLVFLSAMYAYYRARVHLKVYSVITPVLVIFLILEVYHKPFTNRLIHVIDCWLMYNLIFVFTTTWIFVVENKMQIATIITVVAVSLVFVTFVMILGYHILHVIGKIHLLKKVVQRIRKINCRIISNHSSSRGIYRSLDDSDFFSKCSNYREPLMSLYD